MIKIFIDDISTIKTDDEFNEIFLLLPNFRQNKINSYKFDQDRKLSLVAGKLLHEALIDLKYGNLEEKIVEDENGKPYIPGNPIYFSISHSGTKAMVAISDKEVGCDIQIIKNNDISLADRFFTDSECDEISKSDNPTLTFYKMWTIKESYMKLTGKGLSLGLKNIRTDGCKLNNRKYKTYFVETLENYIACYVAKK